MDISMIRLKAIVNHMTEQKPALCMILWYPTLPKGYDIQYTLLVGRSHGGRTPFREETLHKDTRKQVEQTIRDLCKQYDPLDEKHPPVILEVSEE